MLPRSQEMAAMCVEQKIIELILSRFRIITRCIGVMKGITKLVRGACVSNAV